MFNALKPIYHPQGENFRVTWEVLGIAFSMADAKKRYGGYPVLELIRGV